MVNGQDGYTWHFRLGYAAKDRGKPWHDVPPPLMWGISDEARFAATLRSLSPRQNRKDQRPETAHPAHAHVHAPM